MGRNKETSPQRASLPVVQTPPYTTAGHGLSDAEFRSDSTAVDHAVDARYSWDRGIAIGRWLAGLREGDIQGSPCPSCGRLLLPPRMFCERCFRETEPEWKGAGAVGVVNTFSICHIRWDMQPLDPPEIPAVIDFPGTSGGFLHKLGDVDPENVRIGMEVVPVWKPEEERTGSILDIAYFRPKEENEHAISGSRVMSHEPAGGNDAPRPADRMEGSIPIRHRYTAGVANKAFFEALRDRGVLLGSRCGGCEVTYLPARLFCERCFSELSADVECGPGGTLESFTVGHVGVNREPLDEPVTFGLAKVDRADTVLMHRIVDASGRLQIGDRVEVVLASERSGSMLDIEGFRPVS
ncbi:MAG: Zn-ribbon domain-containing OB-fold protein [Actinomycetota bacterium]